MPRSFPAAVLAVVGVIVAPAFVSAAVVVVANATAEPVRFTVALPNQQPVAQELAPGESRPFACGRTLDITITRDGKPTALRLDAYTAYVFATKKGVTELFGVELAGKPVPLDDVPAVVPAAAAPLKVPVKLLVDDADRRTRRVWEDAVRRRFDKAAEVVAAHVPVKFEVVAVAEWASDPAGDLAGLYGDFEKSVKLDTARLAIGYTSRLPDAPAGVPFASGKAALQTHILFREREPRSEPERVEVLIQQLGKYLGAVHSPDPGSAMRPKLGDGKAAYAKFRLGIDPLNTLAMNIWVEELRAGKPARITDIRPAAQARLARIYATLVNALPDEPLPEDYVAVAAKAGELPPEPRVAVEPRKPEPKVAVEPRKPDPPAQVEVPKPPVPEFRPERGLTAKQDAVRKVVRAIVQRAEQNASAGTKVRGDELTSLYLQTAADVARFEDKEMRPTAFLIGIGLALDDSQILRKNPLTAEFCKAVESDDERKARLAVIGLPTVRNRRDLCQHFVISAALTELVGAGKAELAGLLKEQLDMSGPSGFSFTDLCADLAGVSFGRVTRKDPDLLEQWWRKATVTEFVPKMDGLRDGLSAERFKEDYGSFDDVRFTKAMDELRARVKGLSLYTGLDK